MRLKSVSALMFVIAGLALVTFETSVYGVRPVEAAPIPAAPAIKGGEVRRSLGNDNARGLRTCFRRARELRAEKIEKSPGPRPAVCLVPRHA